MPAVSRPAGAPRARPASRLPDAAPRDASPPASEARAETPYERYLRVFSNGMKGDLIGGEAVIDLSATILHERLFRFLFTLINLYVQERGLGQTFGSRTLVKVDDENGYEPDVLFVRADRLDVIGEMDITEHVDVAVEIVSRTSGTCDCETKFEGYERIGVPEYWLVDPLRGEAAFYRLGDEGAYRAVPLQDGVFVSEALAGFCLDPQVLFADPLPSVLPLLAAMLAEPLPGTEDEAGAEGTA